jgi:hypothetical protein
MFDNLSDTQFTALSKAFASESRRRKPTLSSGLHRVDSCTLTVQSGSVSVGEPEDYTPTIKIPLLDTMVIGFHRAGFQRDGIAQIIIDAASEALSSDNRVGDELKTTISYVQQEVKDLQAALSANLPTATRKGKVKSNIHVVCEDNE